MKQLSERKIEAIKILIEAIKEDYRSWGSNRAAMSDTQDIVRAKMIQEFNEQISYTVGKKYIKIIQRNSVWGFVVNCEDDKLFPLFNTREEGQAYVDQFDYLADFYLKSNTESYLSSWQPLHPVL
mgnify:CR=1 FL=1